MEKQEVLKPVFATFPPYNILNLLPSGAIQETKGDITPQGIWVNKGDSFYVILPYNNKHTTIRRYIDYELAVRIDWNKIIRLISEKRSDNKISSNDIEKDEVVELLAKINVVNLDGNRLFILPEYQMSYNQKDILYPIDITSTANPRSQEKESNG